MANEVLLKTGTAIVLGKSASHSPAANNNLGTITDEIDLTSLAAGAARQSAKFDFGSTRARRYAIFAALEWATAPAAGAVESVDIYLAFSPSGTAAVANPGGVSGSDSAYAGYSSNLDDSLKQLTFIGSSIATVQATGTVQIATVGTFTPIERYATLVVDNSSASDNLHNDMVEMSILITPIVDEIQ
jgi:hypothetical protein